jgi:2-polyprenyl-6-methoxyphenol hydroxylase-like FAD-dependent oxidoreductase
MHSASATGTAARKALIVGGGVAGPVAAMFLQRAGLEAEVYEARGASTSGVKSEHGR